MVDSDGNPQILNFGLMEFKRSSQEHIVLWIAPEFINGLVEKLDKSADIYSFAMLMVKVGYRSFLWPTGLTVDSCHTGAHWQRPISQSAITNYREGYFGWRAPKYKRLWGSSPLAAVDGTMLDC